MLARNDLAVLLSLSVASALILSGVAAEVASSRPTPAGLATSGLPSVRRAVVWYGVPQAAPRSLTIQSTSINASVQDEYQITYSGGNFTLVYQRVAGGPITSRYTLSVDGLLEWNSTGSDGAFEGENVVAYTPLGPSTFGRYPVEHTQNMTNGVAVDTFTIASNKGEIVITLTIANGFVTLPSGQTLTPMEAKLTFAISHNMTRPDSRLSLQLGIGTDQKVSLENQSWDDENHFSTDEHAVNVSNDAPSGLSTAYFAWSNTATVNGQAGPVVASGPMPNGTSGYDLYLTYPRPAPGTLHLQITHDPTMGVVSAAYLAGIPPESPLPFQGDALVYVVSLVGISAFVIATVLAAGRRRRKAP